jgi:hypothetical protein
MITQAGGLLWKYAFPGAEALGALPPKSARFRYGVPHPSSPYRRRQGFEEKWRAIEAGYEVSPADCPAIRSVSRFGWILRCPGTVNASRAAGTAAVRSFGEGYAEYGKSALRGDTWPNSDSGLVVSWIAGSEYIKVHTGIVVLFPARWMLYQGPLPNAGLQDKPLPVMAGMETFKSSRTVIIDGQPMCVASMNAILHLPPRGGTLSIHRGEPLLWIFPVPMRPSLQFIPAGQPYDSQGIRAL